MTETRQKPTLCLVHEDIGTQSAIAKIALWTVRHALDAGWQVTVVAQNLDGSLLDRVEWLPLYKPKRLFLYQWLIARPAIRAAVGNRSFDVLHVYQPQVAALSDVIHCQFLTRVAWERRCLETGVGARARLVRAQQQGVLFAEDYYYRRRNPRTRFLYCSEMLQQEFDRLYGRPPLSYVLENAAPPMDLSTADERKRARAALVPEAGDRIVVGYLGGLDERKGYQRLIQAMQQPDADDLFLLMGGLYTGGHVIRALPGRHKCTGTVGDTAAFYAACDVFVVPSRFEPWGLVVFEAATRGVPVIAAEGVGSLPALLRYEAGLAWLPDQRLPPLIRAAVAAREKLIVGTQRAADALSERRQAARLLEIYGDILAEKSGRKEIRKEIR